MRPLRRAGSTPLAILLLALAALGGPTVAAEQGALTFEDRVAAQEAIERVYYSHQVGATKPFEEAVPRELLETKVRRYLKQSVALAEFWNAPVTTAVLESETNRLAQRTRLPERLREIYGALGNDPVLFEECYARQVVVDRLTRDFFASDESIHAEARQEADALRGQLLSGALEVGAPHPRRSVVTVRHGLTEEIPSAEAPSPVGQRSKPAPRGLYLSPEEFLGYRALAPSDVGVSGPVVDDRDSFTITIVLSETDDSLEIATFDVPKVAWSDWWDAAGVRFDEAAARQVVTTSIGLLPPLSPIGQPTPFGSQRDVGAALWDSLDHAFGDDLSCEGSWDNGGLDDLPDPRYSHTAVWTGTQMIVWGGSGSGGDYLSSGGRYDPTTDTWSPTSSTNSPSGRYDHTAVWTGTQMIVWGGFSNGYLSSGGRYDPTTVTPRSAPSGPADADLRR